MREFLYRIQPTRPGLLSEGPTEAEAAIASEHRAYVERLAREGTVRLAGRTDTADAETFGIVILRAGTEDEARAIMENDPAVRDGLMSGRLFPFRIAFEAPR